MSTENPASGPKKSNNPPADIEKALEEAQVKYRVQLVEKFGKLEEFPFPTPPFDGVYTFIFMSDVHTLGDKDEGDLRFHLLQNLIQSIKNTPNYSWPQWSSVPGQPIATPLFVTINGDLTGDTAVADGCVNGQLAQFRKLFQQNQESYSIPFPTFIGLGNHDIDWQYWWDPDACQDLMWAYINWYHGASPLQPVSYIDDDPPWWWWFASNSYKLWQVCSYNYIIVFPDVIFVQLHRFGGDTKFGHEPGMDWLTDTLDNYGNKPLVVFQHYGWDSFSEKNDEWWTQEQRDALLAALRPYNVIGFFHAHIHKQMTYQIPGTVFNAFVPGAAKNGNFGICRLDTHKQWIDVAFCSATADGTVQIREDLYYSGLFPGQKSNWAPNSGIALPSPWNWTDYSSLIGGGNGVLFARQGDSLLWFQDMAQGSDVPPDQIWDPKSGTVISESGWADFTHICSGGQGVIYAIKDDNLFWAQFDGFDEDDKPLWRVNSPAQISVGGGWSQFQSIFSPGNGIIYAYSPGYLYWFQSLAYDGQAPEGQWFTPGSGMSLSPPLWGQYAAVFGGEQGIIYAVSADQQHLYWYRDLSQNGSSATTWDPYSGQDIWAQDWSKFPMITSGGNGVIYAVDASGFIHWFQNLVI